MLYLDVFLCGCESVRWEVKGLVGKPKVLIYIVYICASKWARFQFRPESPRGGERSFAWNLGSAGVVSPFPSWERERAFTGGGLKDSPRRHDQASLISGPVGAVSDHQYDQPPSLLSHNNRRNKKTCISRTSSVLYFCLPHLFFCFGGPHYVVLLRSKDESVSGIVDRCIPTRCSLTMNGGRMKAVLEHCDALQTAGRESLLYGGNTEQNWEGHCAC